MWIINTSMSSLQKISQYISTLIITMTALLIERIPIYLKAIYPSFLRRDTYKKWLYLIGPLSLSLFSSPTTSQEIDVQSSFNIFAKVIKTKPILKQMPYNAADHFMKRSIWQTPWMSLLSIHWQCQTWFFRGSEPSRNRSSQTMQHGKQ